MHNVPQLEHNSVKIFAAKILREILQKMCRQWGQNFRKWGQKWSRMVITTRCDHYRHRFVSTPIAGWLPFLGKLRRSAWRAPGRPGTGLFCRNFPRWKRRSQEGGTAWPAAHREMVMWKVKMWKVSPRSSTKPDHNPTIKTFGWSRQHWTGV